MYVRFPAEKSVTRQLFTDAVLKPDALDHWRCSASDLIEKTGADPEMLCLHPIGFSLTGLGCQEFNRILNGEIFSLTIRSLSPRQTWQVGQYPALNPLPGLPQHQQQR